MSYMDELNFWLMMIILTRRPRRNFWQSAIMKQKWKIVFTRNWNSVPAAYVV